MKEAYLSTKEVAALLNVTETTIKRWSDSGHLECVKTLGGHRKFSVGAIERFAGQNNISITGSTGTPNTRDKNSLSYAVYSNDFFKASEVVLREALKGDRDALFKSLLYLFKNQVKYPVLIDEIISPALVRIGEMWEQKQLSVNEEHLASDTIKTAIGRLVMQLPESAKKNVKVICACVPGEHHDIPLQALGYGLEMNGFILHYLGANTPFESMLSAARKIKPSFIMISAVAPNIKRSGFVKEIRKLSAAAKKLNAWVILGGSYAAKFSAGELGCYAVCKSISEAVTIMNKRNL